MAYKIPKPILLNKALTFSALCLTCCASSTLILVECRRAGASPGSPWFASFSALSSACSALASSVTGCLTLVEGAFLEPGGFKVLCLLMTAKSEYKHTNLENAFYLTYLDVLTDSVCCCASSSLSDSCKQSGGISESCVHTKSPARLTRKGIRQR